MGKKIQACFTPSRQQNSDNAQSTIVLHKRQIREHIKNVAMMDSVHEYEQAFEATLHGRLTQHSHSTRFVVPFVSVGKNWKGMSHHYHIIKTHSHRNYRDLVMAMFTDRTLRSSLNQGPVLSDDYMLSRPCKNPDAPIENFPREQLELFTVGLAGHNYTDILILSKALNTGCYNRYKAAFEKE